MSRSKLGLALIAILSLTGISAEAQASSPRYFDGNRDQLGTLRVCYRVESIRATVQPEGFEAKLVYSGEAKLDRLRSYPSIRDIELKRLAVLDPANEIVHAFQKQIYVCEVIWDYGDYWVVSTAEVSGDR